ncbi:MAG: CvpA family protein [Candidatus Omnitrophica bacterium]|nr:CvpA family protein [Candidatus Omnitrophota bacterium]
MSNGLVVEFFKLIGVIFSVCLGLHYYIRLGEKLSSIFKIIPPDRQGWYFVVLSVLFSGGSLIFVFLREFFLKLTKIEMISFLNRWFSLFLGILRAFIFASFIMFLFSIPKESYLKKSVEHSFLGRHILFISPFIYKSTWQSFFSKFLPLQEFNLEIFNVEKN